MSAIGLNGLLLLARGSIEQPVKHSDNELRSVKQSTSRAHSVS